MNVSKSVCEFPDVVMPGADSNDQNQTSDQASVGLKKVLSMY